MIRNPFKAAGERIRFWKSRMTFSGQVVSLKLKVGIIAIFAAVVVALSMAVSGVIISKEQLNMVADTEMLAKRTLWQKIVQRQMDFLRATVNEALNNENLVILKRRDIERLETFLTQQWDNSRGGAMGIRLTFYDFRDGLKFTAGNDGFIRQKTTSPRQSLQEAVNGRSIVDGIEFHDGQVSVFVMVRVIYNGERLGVVEARSSLRPLLGELAESLSAEVAFVPQAVLAKRDDALPGVIAISATAVDLVRMVLVRRIELEQGRQVVLSAGGRTFATTLLAVRDFNGNPVGGVIVSSDFSSIAALLSGGLRRHMLITLTGFAIAAAVIILTLNRSFQPLNEMLSAINRIADGDFTAPIPKGRDREIAVLSSSLCKMVREISDRQRMLMESEKRAYAASDAKSAFLASMSHELRTPLNAIIGYSEMIDECEEDLPETVRQDNRCIREAAGSLLDIVDNILKLATLEDCGESLDLQNIRLKYFFSAFEQPARSLVADKPLDLVWQIDVGEAEAYVDEQKLGVAFMNILDNAVKFTERGRIVVRADVKGVAGKQVLRVGVKDTGIGIAGDKLDSLFDPFTQADAGYSRHYDGVGLGLTIAHRYCRLMGGHIHVRSSEKAGSEFIIAVPLLKQQDTGKRGGGSAGGQVTAGETV